MTSLAVRFGLSFSYFFVTIVLGALAMGFFWFYLPDEFVQLQRLASAARDWIAAHAWSTRTESILRFLLEERQLLLIGFVLTIRFFLGLVGMVIKAIALQLKPLFIRGDPHAPPADRPAGVVPH